MKIVDANVLLYATDETAHHHQASRRWLEAGLAGSEPVGFAWIVLLAFLRLSTSPRVYERPLSPHQATETVLAWLSQPAAFVIEPTERHIHVLASLLRIAGSGGNLVSDAHLAALAQEHQAEIVSFDSDFDRFTGVRWMPPEPPPMPVSPE